MLSIFRCKKPEKSKESTMRFIEKPLVRWYRYTSKVHAKKQAGRLHSNQTRPAPITRRKEKMKNAQKIHPSHGFPVNEVTV
jgi:hypothetical protein